MTRSSKQSIIDGDRVFKATNVKKIHPVYLGLAECLSNIDILQFIKIYNDRLCASNLLSNNGKKEPIVATGRTGIIGVELLIDPAVKTVQLYFGVDARFQSVPSGRKKIPSVDHHDSDHTTFQA